MTEAQYQKLCEYCDRLLQIKDVTTQRVANHWLHVIREHPSFLVNYEEIFNSNSKLSNYLKNKKRSIWYRLARIRDFLKVLLNIDSLAYQSKNLPEKVDVLFISHFVSISQVNDSIDFYFGDLPIQLSKLGYKVIIALIDHTKNNTISDLKFNHQDNVYRIVLPKLTSFHEEIGIWKELREDSKLLAEIASNQSDQLFKNVAQRASQEVFSSGTFSAMRIGRLVDNLVKKLHPSLVLTTYEGHSWERLAFSSAKMTNENIKTVAYNHAVIFRLQHAMRRGLTGKFNPDVILTAGDRGKVQLENSPSLNNSVISTLGTHRLVSGKVEANYAATMKKIQSKENICLVLPEGIVAECVKLFEFSIECARLNPEIKFIWRLHPVISFESFVKQYPEFKSFPSNILLSTSSLEFDIDKSRWAIYRGSTAIIPAIMSGVRPIYFESSNEMTIDPLYDISVWKCCITDTYGFNQVVENDLCHFTKNTIKELNMVQLYCESIFTKLDSSALINLLPKR